MSDLQKPKKSYIEKVDDLARAAIRLSKSQKKLNELSEKLRKIWE